MSPNHRLLYRGALSLPDSHMLLDGLSFAVKVGDSSASPSHAPNLLNNPLALALESMRGRPSLHLLGTVRLKDTWIDPSGDVAVNIHPQSFLSRTYFESILCLTPITSSDGRTEHGIRVSLSDSSDPGTSDILIYGQLRFESSVSNLSTQSTSIATPQTLHILAARIFPGPPPVARLPRPDDPTPRRPPLAFGTKRKRELSGPANELDDEIKRSKTSGKGKAVEDEAMVRAREVMLHMPKSGPVLVARMQALGKDVRVGNSRSGAMFKVPRLPARVSSVDGGADVFGAVSQVRDGESSASALFDGVEKENKTAVKRAAVRCLADRGITKRHQEFNDLFQYIYRGTSFALVQSSYVY
ncbi:hypothetical protein A0H81_10078 [Grifola frondosa]|uniref:Sld7 C-terminal domain-containing protein n=1 Tax=Grifola frondosa TaxID=5627 RepID=A0A1C7LZ15_GRIFR|nr:hypothetical protein A0H81_10078 [Grifola frondosa]